ncbi:MAG: restriction endonuclease subunit S [Urechidicola sp.]|nr:restriction endonuclease subunit S [Urechidicola sp.]
MKKGWEIKKISDVGRVFNGNSINAKVKKEKYLNLNEGIPYIATKDVSYKSIIDYDNGISIPFDEKSDFKIASENTILICAEGGSAGRKIGFTNQEVCFGNKLFALTTNKNSDSKYVYYFYFSNRFQKDFHSQMTGIIGGVSMNKFKSLEIPLPPLPEQQRIVAVLDKAFTAIATAKENAQQNLQNVKEIFESYLQNVFEDNKWSKTTLSQITDDISDGDHMPPPKTETGIPFITISNINKETCSIDFSKTFYVSAEYFENIKSKRKPKKGDVLYTVTGSYGIPVLIESNFEFCFQRHIGLLRPKKDINSKWLFYWILSPQALKQANETATGTAQRTVSLKALRNFIVPKTPIEEQEQIVKKLNSLSVETKKLEVIYQQKIDDLEELKKSVLNKAFKGEL